MSLFSPNSQTALITEDDDSGRDTNARIISDLSAGTYFVRIRHFQAVGTGAYGVSVRAEEAQPDIAEIQVNGPPVQGSIQAANESDIYRFAASATGLYTIETADVTDTFLTLFGPNNQTTPITQDDDSGPEFNSRIVADLVAGIYFVRIRHVSPTGTGAYSISVGR
jgi:tyrosinase